MTQDPKPAAAPIILELAPLAREQAGPFLILGVPKTAAPDQVEANWAKRVIWARKKITRTLLEDVNWAREILNDPDKRVLADAASLNIDTTDGTLRELESRFEGTGANRPGCQPIDEEKPLADYAPPAEIPTMEEIRAGITLPQLPREFPAVRRLLEEFARQPIDPWEIE